MVFTKSTAKTTVKVTGEPLKITHDFQPSTKTDNLYEISVTYENLSATKTLTDLRYRRVMDFDVPPNIFDECISIFYSGGTNPKYLEYAHNDGFLDVNPTNNVSGNTRGLGPCPGNCPSGGEMDYGPKDQGALFNLFFENVSIPPGGKFDFKIYYGAAETKTAADAAVNAVGATMGAYAFNAVGGSCSASDGSNPGVFIFAFSEGPSPCELPPGGCVANGDQYCCANDDSRYNVCTWDNNLNLYPITMPVAPGTKCCQSPWGNRITQQHHLMSCPA
jgi:type IV pilus assembly protein PilY1